MASLADALAYQAKRSQYVDDMTEQPSDLEKAVQDQFGMQPNMDRGALLPYKSKDKGWVAPEVAYQLAKLLASPSVAMHGGNISPQEAIESANTLSGFMTPAGLLSKPSPAMARMNVYHGSPHKFDAFDASKIGTGEGGQAYGHGLYLAESPDVARAYQNALSKYGELRFADGTTQNIQDLPYNSARQIAGQLWMKKPNFQDAKFALGNLDSKYLGQPKQEVLKELESLRDASASLSGSFYKVDLPDDQIAKMLDWDKPLSQQAPEVQKALGGIESNFPAIPDFNLRKWMDADPLASTWHNVIQRDLGVTPDAIAKTLKDRGIPGIRYLDAGSRTGGAGTSNFVVFPGEEKNLKILSRE